MNRAVSRLVPHSFDEARVREAAEEMRAELGAPPTLAIAFISTDYTPHLEDFQEIITVHGHASQLVGSTGSGLIGTRKEAEMASGFSLLFLYLPQGKVRTIPLAQGQVETAESDTFWQEVAGGSAETWLTLANPFRFDTDTWLKEWNRAFPQAPTLGGLASGPDGEENVVVFGPAIGQTCDALAIALDGVRVETVISQGCRPIGEALPITRADEHLLLELGSRPAYQVLEQAFNTLAEAENSMLGAIFLPVWRSTSTTKSSAGATFLSATFSGRTRPPARSWLGPSPGRAKRCSTNYAMPLPQPRS